MRPDRACGPRRPRPGIRALSIACPLLLSCATAPTPAQDHHADRASFQYLGVIEGFYGPPWSHQDRLDILAFMEEVGLADYVYAPKDDPYHRARWRDPYPPEDAGRLRELITAAAGHGVTFWYAISPGLSMTYAGEEDYRALLDKLEQVGALGVTHFGLFLDDVPPTLAHDEDRSRYGSLAEAHIDLTNRLHTDLAHHGWALLLTPTTYTDAWGDREYLARVGAGVHPEVPVVWTGIDVASPTVTGDQARAWSKLTGRQPLVWDNYPVNDYATWRLFLGPWTGRGPDLPATTLGILANPMNQAHASMIPLATLAAYARDPAAYDPSTAIEAALRDVLGEEAGEAVRPLIRVFGGPGWEAGPFDPLYFLRDTIDLAPIRSALQAGAGAVTALEALASSRPRVQHVLEEAKPVLNRLESRFQELEVDSRYRPEGDRLVFAIPERFTLTHSISVRTDGVLDEWQDISARHLTGPGPVGLHPTLRLTLADEGTRLAVALEVPLPDYDIRTGNHLGEGDHLALILDEGPPRNRYNPNSLVALFPPPDSLDRTGNVIATTLAFRGFMARWLADNENLTFSEFHLTTFGREPTGPTALRAHGLRYAAHRRAGGFDAEISIPLAGATHLRMHLMVVDRHAAGRRVFSLTARRQPINPATWASVDVGSR